MPADVAIQVHEESATTLHLVLPAQRESNLQELSDEELEQVSGGAGTDGVRNVINAFGYEFPGNVSPGTSSPA